MPKLVRILTAASLALAASLLAAATLCGSALPARASIITVTGDTTGGPTFNRPLEDLTGLSAVGTAVRYDTITFSASVSGDYTFLTTGEFDTFSILYSGAFLPGSPLTNAVVADDDLISPPFTTSGFASTLTAGATYVLVTTGFGNTDFGAWSTTIGGPGELTLVPEPALGGIVALGLVGVVLRGKRTAASADA